MFDREVTVVDLPAQKTLLIQSITAVLPLLDDKEKLTQKLSSLAQTSLPCVYRGRVLFHIDSCATLIRVLFYKGGFATLLRPVCYFVEPGALFH